jgi:beta-barrel assembly-enhancing protease
VPQQGIGSFRSVPAGLFRLVPGFLLLLFVSGCISEAREQEMGDEMAADINRQIPLVQEPLLNHYVSTLGNSLAAVSDRPDLEYQFYIINSALVNAFALPGGHIYVTRGLLQRTETGKELAGVLAHEIGHVAARHGVQKLQRHLRTGSVVNMLYNLILGGEPELLRRNSLQLAGVVWSASHSREDEEEADRLAVEYLTRAGLDPEGIVTLLESLMEDGAEDTSRIAGWFSTHPMTAERIAIAQEEIALSQTEEVTPPAIERRIASFPVFLRLLGTLPPPPDAHVYNN